MNRKLVFGFLGKLILLEAALMLPSFFISLVYRDGDQTAFLISVGILLAVGLVFTLCFRAEDKNMYTREGLAVAGLGWLTLSALGGLPLALSGACGFADAFFEITSGFTTTGATIFTDVESLPHGILFWRSFTHWIGGMGFLVLTTALLPSIGGKGGHLARAETPGPAFSKIRPKLGDSAKTLYIIYAALTLLLFICLRAAGMSGFDAVTHAFGTAGTGGFSNLNTSVGGYGSAAIEIIIAVFMLLFGLNFAVYFKLLMGDVRGAFTGEETWCFLGIVTVSTLGIALNLRPITGMRDALRQAFFQVTSIVSTTGFSSADFNLWPPISKTILLLLMLIGSCAGSTAGGLKLVRAILLVKIGGREARRAFQPRKVRVIKLDGKTVPEEMLSQITVFFFLYVFLILIGAVVIALDGADVVTAFTGSLACMSNIGPGLSAVGPMGSFAFFSPWTKVFLSLLMLAGRLEIFPMLALFCVSFWKKS